MKSNKHTFAFKCIVPTIRLLRSFYILKPIVDHNFGYDTLKNLCKILFDLSICVPICTVVKFLISCQKLYEI